MNARRFLLAAAALALAQYPPSAPAGPAPAPQASVTIDNFSFKAPAITIAAGTRVTWTNRDDIPHTITADGIPPAYHSHPLDTGEQFSMVFDKAGTFRYYCSLHPKMRGTVTVQ